MHRFRECRFRYNQHEQVAEDTKLEGFNGNLKRAFCPERTTFTTSSSPPLTVRGKEEDYGATASRDE